MRTRIDTISDGKGRESISVSALERRLGGRLGGFALAFGRSCGSGGNGRRWLGGAGVVCTALGHFEGEFHLRLVRRARLVFTHSINKTVLTGQLPRSPTPPAPGRSPALNPLNLCGAQMNVFRRVFCSRCAHVK
jgi:hypothetical protein